MMKTETLGKLFSLIASVVLLLSWTVQQLLFDEWNATLSRIGTAESVFHSYRSTNAVMKSLAILSPQELKDRIEVEQFENYRRGILEISKTVSAEQMQLSKQRGIETLPEGIQYESLSANAKILLELESIQRVLASERSSLGAKKELAEKVFVGLYFLGAILTISGGFIAFRNARPKWQDIDA